MLTVSKQQLQQLEDSLDQRFVGRVIEFLCQQLKEPVARCDRRELEARVSSDLRTARAYAITKDADLARWCFIAFVCGSSFHEAEDIRGFLQEPLMTASAKMDFLMRSLAHSLSQKQDKD